MKINWRSGSTGTSRRIDEMIEIKVTQDYDKLVPFFIENGLEFSEDEPTPTDLVKCWAAEEEGHFLTGR